MNFFKLSGSTRVETCSAETTVPCITRMSSPASRASGDRLATFCGVRLAAVTTPVSLHLLDAPTDQVGLDRLQVYLLHPAGRLLGGEIGNLVVVGIRVLVPSPEPLQVEDTESAQLADGDRRFRAERRVHRRSQHGQLKAEGIELP